MKIGPRGCVILHHPRYSGPRHHKDVGSVALTTHERDRTFSAPIKNILQTLAVQVNDESRRRKVETIHVSVSTFFMGVAFNVISIQHTRMRV